MTIRKVAFTDYARSPLCVWSASARLLCMFLYSNFTAPVPLNDALRDLKFFVFQSVRHPHNHVLLLVSGRNF